MIKLRLRNLSLLWHGRRGIHSERCHIGLFDSLKVILQVFLYMTTLLYMANHMLWKQKSN